MNLTETKEVKVGPNTFKVRMTNRAMIEFENMSGSSVVNLNGTEGLIQFFYCTAKAGAKHEGVEFKHTYDEFLDLIDDYVSEVVVNFSKAIANDEAEPEKKA